MDGEDSMNVPASNHIAVEFTVAETSIAAGTLILIMVLTILGNITICVVIFRNKRMWTEMNMFLLNLALGDLALSMSMGFSLVTAIKREWIYGRDGPICVFNALLTSTLFCNTIFTHTMISIDRYMAVVMPLKKIMTKRKAALMILGSWILSLVIALAPVFGWGSIDYNGTTMQCGPTFPKTKFESLYLVILALVGFVFPIAIMSCVYTKIYIVVKRHTRRISLSMVGRAAKDAAEVQRKIAVTFFLALDAFVLCWSPFFAFIIVVVVISSRDDIPHGLGIAAFWCGYLNGVCNPFIFGLRSHHFHKTFHKLLCWPLSLYRRRYSSQNGSSRNAELANSTRVINMKLDRVITDRAFSNGGLQNVAFNTVEEEVDSRKVKTGNMSNGPSENNRENHRRSGAQVKDAFVFERYIHIIGDKVWNEAGV